MSSHFDDRSDSPPSSRRDEAAKLLDWFQSSVKPFLQDVQPEKVAPLESDSRNLQAVIDNEEELAVCFLGNAGVGKSTLINSLVAGREIILPAGGIGPLTAQALAVRYAPCRKFEVEYHPPHALWRLAFVLETALKRDAERERALILDSDDLAQKLDADAREDALEVLSSNDPHTTKKLEEMRRQAQLLITGDQHRITEMEYLVDALREATGKKRIWNTEPRPEDAERTKRIVDALAWAESAGGTRIFRVEDEAFDVSLRDHASGFLAPLIKELRVYWDTPLLRDGVTLVDLPGIGIVNDIYEATTAYWIRERARAIILVVETRGLNATHIELLRMSGFLNRLLYSADDPSADPVQLMVAVVKGDLIAEDEFQKDRTRKRREHFAEVCRKSAEHIRHQLRSQLEEIWESGDARRGEIRKEVIDTILADLQVHPVSAVQYRKLLENDEEDRAFITEPAQSGVPGLVDGLRELARRRREVHALRLQEVGDDFFHRVLATVKVNEVRWKEESRATEEAERLRSELDEMLTPLRKEFHARQGAYREYLRETLPAHIRDSSKKPRRNRAVRS